MRFYATRRSYATPALSFCEAKPFVGMSESAGVGLAAAAFCENMFPDARGNLRKRTGFAPELSVGVVGKVCDEAEHKGVRYLYTEGEKGAALVRLRGDTVESRAVKGPVSFVHSGGRLYILTKGAWFIALGSGALMLLTKNGVATVTNTFTEENTCSWSLTQSFMPVPLVRVGSSPSGGGLPVEPPSLLSPFRKESFVYSKSDAEAKRNRFCLAFSPIIKGKLPTNADGSHIDISEANKEIRIATLKKTAVLEVRLLKTDAYGNRVDYWKKRSWSHADNISAEDAAFWVENMHGLNLAFDGDDNVRITYMSSGQAGAYTAADVLSASLATLSGVGGKRDRLVVAGEDTVFFSEAAEPLYFAHTRTLVPDKSGARIRLVTGKDGLLSIFTDSGLYRAEGKTQAEAGEYAERAYFALSACLPAPLPINSRAVVAGGELLYLAAEGLCAVTPSGVLAERCVAVRSGQIKALLAEEAPTDLSLAACGRQIWVGGKKGVYVFDAHRVVSTPDGKGFAAYFWRTPPAECVGENTLWSGGNRYRLLPDTLSDNDDYVNRFDKIRQNMTDYVDRFNGEQTPIVARFQSGKLTGVHRCNRLLALTLQMGAPASGRLETADGGRLPLYGWLSAFHYDFTDYGGWSYGDSAPRVRRMALPFSHRRAVGFTLVNDVPFSPFIVENIIAEYK